MKIANSISVTGKIGNMVYQKTAPGLGNVPGDTTGTLQMRAYVAHNTSNTPAQAARRNKFREAMAAWAALSPEQKQQYKNAAAARALHGVNLFTSQFMKG